MGLRPTRGHMKTKRVADRLVLDLDMDMDVVKVYVQVQVQIGACWGRAGLAIFGTASHGPWRTL